MWIFQWPAHKTTNTRTTSFLEYAIDYQKREGVTFLSLFFLIAGILGGVILCLVSITLLGMGGGGGFFKLHSVFGTSDDLSLDTLPPPPLHILISVIRHISQKSSTNWRNKSTNQPNNNQLKIMNPCCSIRLQIKTSGLIFL